MPSKMNARKWEIISLNCPNLRDCTEMHNGTERLQVDGTKSHKEYKAVNFSSSYMNSFLSRLESPAFSVESHIKFQFFKELFML